MARLAPSAATSLFPIAFDETDVRRLCGPATFARGDALERQGHVIEPLLGEGSLQAEVVGTWRRVDRVTVNAVRGQMEPHCSCDAGPFCQHTAALLLHWLRDPESFTVPTGATEPEDLAGDMESAEWPTPVTELAELLNGYTMSQLRDVARRRDFRVTAKNKGELVQRLAPLLADPEGIDVELAQLSLDERILLDAVDLLGAVWKVSPGLAVRTFSALGGESSTEPRVGEMLEALTDIGLVLAEGRQTYSPVTYTVPRAVSSQLPTRDDLVRVTQAGEGTSPPRLAMIQTFQVIAHELTEAGMQAQVIEVSREDLASVPSGWRIPAGERDRRQVYMSQWETRLLPLPSILAPGDRRGLSNLTGQPGEMIDFALSLMASMGLLQVTSTTSTYSFLVREDHMWDLFTLPPAEQLYRMVQHWLAMPDVIDLAAIVDEGAPLQLRFRPAHWSRVGPRTDLVRRFVAHLLGRLPRGTESGWYDFASLLDLLWRLVPSLLSGGVEQQPGQISWRFADSRHADKALSMKVRDDWQRVWSPLVGNILAGPMTWLGLVETSAARRGQVRPTDTFQAFHVQTAAAVLTGGGDDLLGLLPGAVQSHISVGIDERTGEPLVVLPSGAVDPALHALLPRLGELAGASAKGLHYRLTPDRLQLAFDDGLTGLQILELLAMYSGKEAPAEVRRIIEDWWSRYGRVRLYDDLTLIELSDDLLLRELSATTSLDVALLHVFSPRLVAVHPAMADALVAELTRIGHTPRVVEGA